MQTIIQFLGNCFQGSANRRILYPAFIALFLVSPSHSATNSLDCIICPTGQRYVETTEGFECRDCTIPDNATVQPWPLDHCPAITCDGTDCTMGDNHCPWNCDTDYHAEGDTCVYDTETEPCSITNGTGERTRTWNTGSNTWNSWNTCTVIGCDTDYRQEGNTCVPNTVSCEAGYYLPANSEDCELCLNGSICPSSGTYTMYSSVPQGIQSCPSGQTGDTRLGAISCIAYRTIRTSAGPSAVVRAAKNADNDLNLCVNPGDGNVYYGGLSTTPIDGAIRVNVGGTSYYLKPDEEKVVSGGESSDPFPSPGSCSAYTQCPANGLSGSSSSRDCTNLTETNWQVTGCSGGEAGSPAQFSGTSICTDSNDGKPNWNGSNGHLMPGNPFATPTHSDTRNCWCKLTDPARSVWVFHYADIFPAANCAFNCASLCASYALDDSVFRSALFAGF